MKYLACCATALLALFSPAGLALDDFVPADALYEMGLVKYWQLLVPLEIGQKLQDVYFVDDHLYLGTDDGFVYAVDAATGAIHWLRPITRSGYAVRRPCHAGDKVIFVTPVDVQVYERLSGDPIARRDLDFPAGTAPVTDGQRIFIGGLDRRMYALDLETQFLDWRVVTNSAITGAPAIHGEFLFFANDVGRVYGCVAEDKRLLWETAAYGPVTAGLVADERGVFVASRDYSLYLLDLGYGNVRWRARFSGPLYDPPVLTPDVVYQYSPADGLVAVEAEAVAPIDERIRWRLPGALAALTVHDRHTYVLMNSETLASVDPETGMVELTAPAAGLTLPMPAPAAKTIYLAGPLGRVFCARPRGVAPLRAEDLIAAIRGPAPTPAPQVRAATGPTTTAPTVEPLESRRGGAPIGGKSKVSREFRPNDGR
jgi:hypothetical protein